MPAGGDVDATRRFATDVGVVRRVVEDALRVFVADEASVPDEHAPSVPVIIASATTPADLTHDVRSPTPFTHRTTRRRLVEEQQMCGRVARRRRQPLP